MNAMLTNGELQKGALCADTVVGQGNTISWKMCGLDTTTCLTVFFDISPSERSGQQGIPNPQLYIQFLTKYGVNFYYYLYSISNATFVGYCNALDSYSYQNPEGQMRLRVATIMRKWVDGSNTEVSSKRFLYYLQNFR